MELFEAWGETDRSHRKLAYRGSRIGLVHVSPSTLQRVLLRKGLCCRATRPATRSRATLAGLAR